MKLNNFKYIFIFIIVFLTSNFALAQNSSKIPYKIRGKGRQLTITYKGKTHIIKAGDHIDAAKITETEILFASRKQDFLYLVINVFGQSREKQNDRQCGAGEEGNLLWVKLDSAWKIADINSLRYESCWSSTSSEDGYKIDGNILTMEVDNFHENINVKLSYNAAESEKGFQIEKKPLTNSNN